MQIQILREAAPLLFVLATQAPLPPLGRVCRTDEDTPFLTGSCLTEKGNALTAGTAALTAQGAVSGAITSTTSARGLPATPACCNYG